MKTLCTIVAAIGMMCTQAFASSDVSNSFYVEGSTGFLTGFSTDTWLSSGDENKDAKLDENTSSLGFEGGLRNVHGSMWDVGLAYNTFQVDDVMENDMFNKNRFNVFTVNAYYAIPLDLPLGGNLSLGAGAGVASAEKTDMMEEHKGPVLVGHVRYYVPLNDQWYTGVKWSHYRLTSKVHQDEDEGSAETLSLAVGYKF